MMQETTLRELIDASTALLDTHGEQQTIQNIIDHAARVVAAESCALILVDDAFDECFFYTATGPSRRILKQARFRRDAGIAGAVLDSGQPVRVDDTSKDRRHYAGIDRETGLKTRSLIAVPLRSEDTAFGVLEAVNSQGKDTFSQQDADLLQLFGNLAAAVLLKARTTGLLRDREEVAQRNAADDEIHRGRSPAMQHVWNLVARIAETSTTVLITGESGTGKEVIAAEVHRQSDRRDGPYTCVNCAALDTNLLTSELFGHEKGAFTGAENRRKGRFELAHGGTLFLDEIGDAPSTVQARLLRVLETKAFERLGGTETIRSDVRLIAATNADLRMAIAAGTFREDLFHRLHVLTIHIPPLRERPMDIQGYIEFFTQRLASDLNCAPVAFDGQAMQILVAYDWPGNVRELRNVVERATVLYAGNLLSASQLAGIAPLTTRAEQTPSSQPLPPPPLPPAATASLTLWELEKQAIENALRTANWNQAQAARKLGIERHRLRYRIRKFGIKLRPD